MYCHNVADAIRFLLFFGCFGKAEGKRRST
jgi:hypothetical protein